MAKVLISIDDDLLRQVDDHVRRHGLTRSGFVAQLARERIDAGRRSPDPKLRRSIARIRHAVSEAADADVAEDTTAFIRRMRDAR